MSQEQEPEQLTEPTTLIKRKTPTQLTPPIEPQPLLSDSSTPRKRVKSPMTSSTPRTPSTTQAEEISAMIAQNQLLANDWIPRSTSPSGAYCSTKEPRQLNYGMYIFEGDAYPFKGYGSFLASKASNLLGGHNIGGRECMEVHHINPTTLSDVLPGRYANLTYNKLINTIELSGLGSNINNVLSKFSGADLTALENSSPDYVNIPEKLQAYLGKFTPAENSYIKTQVTEMKRLREESAGVGPDSVNSVQYVSKVTSDYLIGRKGVLNTKFNTNLTVMIITSSESSPTMPVIASIIILNNGDETDPTINNGNQYIDVVANNPRTNLYPFVQSSAVPLLLSVVRDTTILSSVLPGYAAMSEMSLSGFVEHYIRNVMDARHKPAHIRDMGAPICPFDRLSLSAVSWQVAVIYRNLNFAVTNVGNLVVNMELPVAGNEDIAILNRYGLVFDILQEIPEEQLRSSPISESELTAIIDRVLAKRQAVMGRFGVPGKPTPSGVAISRGGRQRRRTHKKSRRSRRTAKKSAHTVAVVVGLLDDTDKSPKKKSTQTVEDSLSIS